MADHEGTHHGEWSSGLAFVLAATGSAVGLGNIWKFPFITGENGGGAFVLVYLLCIAVIGIPLMIAEITLGRHSRLSPVNGFRALARESGVSVSWRFVGWLGIVTGFIILSFYSVVAGWALDYTVRAAGGAFTGMSTDAAAGAFETMLGRPLELLVSHTAFMVLTFAIVARGVHAGLERAVTWLMPALFLLLVVLVGYAVAIGDFGRAVAFMFEPDWSRLTAGSVLVAMGHAFFTLSLGMGAIMVYGAYLPARASIARTTLVIAVADTTVALLAGLAIFPIVFVAPGVEAGAGPGLLFQTLPYAFGQMPGGAFFGCLFFVLVSFAALTSAISLLEPVTAYLVEQRDWSRVRACGILSAGIWLLGIASVLSFNVWSGVHPLAILPRFAGRTVFDLLDGLTTNVMLPLGGMGIALFAGWFMKRRAVAGEVGRGVWFNVWYGLIRTVVPVAVVLVMLSSLGVL